MINDVAFLEVYIKIVINKLSKIVKHRGSHTNRKLKLKHLKFQTLKIKDDTSNLDFDPS